MKRSSSIVALTFAAAVVAGIGLGACSGTNPNPAEDAGTTGGTDAGGSVDSGTPMDAGEDAGVDAGEDAGMDAGADAGMDAGEIDAGVDAGAMDAGSTEGVQCGSSVCTGTDQCCGDFVDGGVNFTCAPTCGDAGVVFTCDGPEDCDGGTSVCCGDMQTGAGTPPNCPVKSVTASCASTCTPNVPLMCGANAEIVRCHAKADCAGYGSYSECCTFQQASNAGSFCSTALMANFASSCAP